MWGRGKILVCRGPFLIVFLLQFWPVSFKAGKLQEFSSSMTELPEHWHPAVPLWRRCPVPIFLRLSGISRLREIIPKEMAPAVNMPMEKHPADKKPSASIPRDSKPRESIPNDSKPAERKPSETMPLAFSPIAITPRAFSPTAKKPLAFLPICHRGIFHTLFPLFLSQRRFTGNSIAESVLFFPYASGESLSR